nr:MAG TPA: hypothetical protein [Caudoviricetes sp.]
MESHSLFKNLNKCITNDVCRVSTKYSSLSLLYFPYTILYSLF